MQFIVNFTYNFFLAVILLVLCINLYFTPLENLCRHQHTPIINAIRARNPCNRYLPRLKNLDNITVPRYNITEQCIEIYELLQDLKSLQFCTTQSTILSSIQNITKIDNLQVLALIYKITLNQRSCTEFKLRSVIGLHDAIDLTVKLNKIYEDLNIKKGFIPIFPSWVSSYQAKILLQTKIEYSKSVKIFHSAYEKINITATIAMEKNPAFLDKIETPEMRDFLAGRDEKREAIFFTETSGGGKIKARFVCALESAAKAYPGSDIYLLMAYLPPEGLLIGRNQALYNTLRQYTNIQVLSVDMEKLFKNSRLDKFYTTNQLKTSKYLAAHTSDMIRILAVWEFGGKYFDLDIVTIKNITAKNFIIYETNYTATNIANGAFGFEKFHIVGDYMFEALNERFVGDDWGGNGPGVITGAMRRYTGISNAIDMNESNLKDFKKLRYGSLFPIEHFELYMYFNESQSDITLERIRNVEDLWGLHVGNNILKDKVVTVGSKQAYGLLAQQYCPRAYWSCYTDF